MEQPFLSYVLYLSRTLHRPTFEILAWPHEEITLQQGYDLTCDEKWRARYESEKLVNLSNEAMYEKLKKEANKNRRK